MRGKLAVVITSIIVLIFLAAACTSSYSVQGASPRPSATAEPTPMPTPPEPVTKDIPAYFMPGLTEVGTVPSEPYKIGFIIREAKASSEYKALSVISKKYEERFNVEVLFKAETNAAKQLADAKSMISDNVDFLIISPFINQNLTQIADLCAQEDIPYITLNNRLGATPGENGYVCTIEQDDYLMGVLTGISIVQSMPRKNGERTGNIAEITAKVEDESSQLRSSGIRRVLADFESINIVCCVTGDNDTDTSYKAAVNVLKAFRENELDAIVTQSDMAAVQTLQAILDFDREELVGKIYSMGGTIDGLTGVWYGDFAQTIEDTRQSGMMALEYALQYLEGNGQDIPPVVTQITRVFRADTKEQKDDIAEIIADMNNLDAVACFDNIGSCDLFLPDLDMLSTHYPKPYYEYVYPRVFLAEHEPFSTGEAYYDRAEDQEL